MDCTSSGLAGLMNQDSGSQQSLLSFLTFLQAKRVNPSKMHARWSVLLTRKALMFRDWGRIGNNSEDGTSGWKKRPGGELRS